MTHRQRVEKKRREVLAEIRRNLLREAAEFDRLADAGELEDANRELARECRRNAELFELGGIDEEEPCSSPKS